MRGRHASGKLISTSQKTAVYEKVLLLQSVWGLSPSLAVFQRLLCSHPVILPGLLSRGGCPASRYKPSKQVILQMCPTHLSPILAISSRSLLQKGEGMQDYLLVYMDLHQTAIQEILDQHQIHQDRKSVV